MTDKTENQTIDDGSFPLPSGKRARMDRAKGRHLRQAGKLVR